MCAAHAGARARWRPAQAAPPNRARSSGTYLSPAARHEAIVSMKGELSDWHVLLAWQDRCEGTSRLPAVALGTAWVCARRSGPRLRVRRCQVARQHPCAFAGGGWRVDGALSRAHVDRMGSDARSDQS